MLFILESSSSFNSTKMDLRSSYFGNGTTFISMGFGVTENDAYHDTLREIYLYSLTNKACQNMYKSENITNRMMCAWNNRVSCNGANRS